MPLESYELLEGFWGTEDDIRQALRKTLVENRWKLRALLTDNHAEAMSEVGDIVDDCMSSLKEVRKDYGSE